MQLLPDPREGQWYKLAACKGMGHKIFYTDRTSEQRTYTEARKVCRKCPVRNQCLALALLECDEFGLWGAMTPGERAEFKKYGSIFKVDWSNMIEVSQFRKTYEHYKKTGDELGIDWNDKAQVTSFVLTYQWVFQPTVFNEPKLDSHSE